MAAQTLWLKKRHWLAVKLLLPPFSLYIRWKYGIRVEKFQAPTDQPYLIVMNHQTGYDQFFVSMAFRRPIYFLASEDIFSMGFVSKIIRFLAEPIPIKKQTTDLQAVKNCIRVAREGGTVCLAPEGNRTFHGRTVYMNPAIAGLTKKLGMPLAIFRIEDGYGIHPRWSDVVRRGRMRAYVSRVIQPEEYRDMTNAQLYEVIQKELWVDEARVTGQFRHKKNAELLERVMYVCPWCGLSEFESDGDVIRCKKCDRKIRHLPTKELEGIGCDFPHRFVADWYDYQNDYINSLDTTALTTQPLYEETADLSQVHAGSHKTLLAQAAALRLYGDRLTVGDRVFPFSQTALTILGKNKLNLYTDGEILQLKGGKRFNALKYLNLYHRYKNMTTGDQNGKFLGL